MEMANVNINTKCVQGGYHPGNGEPRQIPIIQSTTFKYDTSEDMGKINLFCGEEIFLPIQAIALLARLLLTVTAGTALVTAPVTLRAALDIEFILRLVINIPTQIHKDYKGY